MAPVSNTFGNSNHGLQIGVNYGNVTANFNSSSEEDIDRDCLKALRCPDSLLVKSRLEEAKDKLHWESIEWVFDTSHYQQWKDQDRIGLLWIKGGAGKGKTMMSIGIIERLLRLKDSSGSTLVTYFFCQNADFELNTLESIVKGLILQLIRRKDDLTKCLRSRWDAQKNCFQQEMSWRNLWDVFLEMLEKCEGATIYILVDALDECQHGGMSEFLRLIVRTGLLNPAKVKWLLTSRPLGDAERELLAGKEQVQVSLELNSVSVEKAIKSYITLKMAEVDRHQRLHRELRQEIEATLNLKSDGTYLWISLACKELMNSHPDRMLDTLTALPADLHFLYHQRCSQLSSSSTPAAKRYMRLLKVMVLTFRPLHILELKSVSGLHEKDERIESLVAQCGSFINIQGDSIGFIHQSARDFLVSQDGHSFLNLHEEFDHNSITLRCLECLSGKLKVDLLERVHPASDKEQAKLIDDERRLWLLTSLRYPAQFWVQHLTEGAESTKMKTLLQDKDVVHAFLESKVLEWIECLIWCEDMHRAIEGLEEIEIMTEGTGLLCALVRDAKRIIERHHHTLTRWPLQIYSSVLLFSPDSSVVKMLNIDKIPAWIKNLPKVLGTSPHLLSVFEGHSGRVTDFAISPDGKQVISASISDTGKAQIKKWDMRTREVLKSIATRGKEHIKYICFSPNGELIAMINAGSIEVRSKDTLDRLNTFRARGCSAVKFCPGSAKIIASYDDESLVMMDIHTESKDIIKRGGKAIRDHLLNSVELSPNGDFMTSISSANRNLEVWKTDGTLIDRFEMVSTVAVSFDGSCIAYASRETTIFIWNIQTRCNQTKVQLADYGNDGVAQLAFSPDGKYLAIGRASGAIDLVDGVDCSRKKILIGHASPIGKILFTPDSATVISSTFANNYTINLWSSSDSEKEDQKIPESILHGVSVSRCNGDIIETRSVGDITEIRTQAGQLVKRIKDLKSLYSFNDETKFEKNAREKLEPEFSRILRQGTMQTASFGIMAISRDEKLVALHYALGSIGIWKTKSQDAPILLKGMSRKGHLLWVTAMDFSPNGLYLASGSADGIVKIWQTTDGQMVKNLKIPERYRRINAVRFSPDGKYLASSFLAPVPFIAIWDVLRCTKRSKLPSFSRNGATSFGNEVICYTRKSENVMVFSSDSNFLLTGSGIFHRVHGRTFDTNTMPKDLWISENWVCLGCFPILRLPSDLRGNVHDTWNDRVVLGSPGGQVLDFRIDSSILEQAFQESQASFSPLARERRQSLLLDVIVTNPLSID